MPPTTPAAHRLNIVLNPLSPTLTRSLPRDGSRGVTVPASAANVASIGDGKRRISWEIDDDSDLETEDHMAPPSAAVTAAAAQAIARVRAQATAAAIAAKQAVRPATLRRPDHPRASAEAGRVPLAPQPQQAPPPSHRQRQQHTAQQQQQQRRWGGATAGPSTAKQGGIQSTRFGASMVDKRSSIAAPWDITGDLYVDDAEQQWTPPPDTSNRGRGGRQGRAVSSAQDGLGSIDAERNRSSGSTSTWTNTQRGAVLFTVLLIAGAVGGLLVVNRQTGSTTIAANPGQTGSVDSSSSVGSSSSNDQPNRGDAAANTASGVTLPAAVSTVPADAGTTTQPPPTVDSGAILQPPQGPPLVSTERPSSSAPPATRGVDVDVDTTSDATTATTLELQGTEMASTTETGTTPATITTQQTTSAPNGYTVSRQPIETTAPAMTISSTRTSIAPSIDPSNTKASTTSTTTTATSTSTTRAFWFNCSNATRSSTSAYTSAESLASQPEGFPYNLPPAAWQEAAVVLPQSKANMLLTLVWIPARDGDGACNAVPVARSYAAYAWEGLMPQPVHPRCVADEGGHHACTVNVTGHADGVYIIHTASRGSTDDDDGGGGGGDDDGGSSSTDHGIVHVPRTPTNAESASRLLVQATFGPTKASIQNVLQDVNGASAADDTTVDMAEAWIEAEMKKPASYHRAYLRKRQNPRVVGDPYAGSIVGTCETGSRWHRYAFNELDESATLVVLSLPLRGKFGLKVNGGESVYLQYRHTLTDTLRSGTCMRCSAQCVDPPTCLWEHEGEASHQLERGGNLNSASCPLVKDSVR